MQCETGNRIESYLFYFSVFIIREILLGKWVLIANFVPGHFCLVLQRLILNLFHGNLSAVDGGDCQVPAVQRVASRHHVARGEHLKDGKNGNN